MDAFVSRKRHRVSPTDGEDGARRANDHVPETSSTMSRTDEEESTDVKLAILSSLYPGRPQEDLLEVLLGCEGSVEKALELLSSLSKVSPQKRRATTIGLQSSLPYGSKKVAGPAQPLTKKGRTLHLYTPEDIAAHTPCSIVHNFLPSELANALLQEILPEVPSYTSATFKLFDNVVQSPHTAQFYVIDSMALVRQKEDYLYNGSNLDDVRVLLPVMRQVSDKVQAAVNDEIKERIASHYPNGRKLKYQSPKQWQPNAAFVNCYDGPQQSVGYHSDQLSYLGPRAVIGSLSLGVAREFRVRKIVPPDSPPTTPSVSGASSTAKSQADVQGQISIHLPHNSLLVMHAEMQEEWKHSIAPAQSIDPHPVAGNKRINITYRWYREEFHPKNTPRCRCGVPTVLKCVQKQKETRGRYIWMCQVGGRAEPVEKQTSKGEGTPSEMHKVSPALSKAAGNSGGCGYFVWAEFTDDGEPIWKH